jgi:hypothetical protein
MLQAPVENSSEKRPSSAPIPGEEWPQTITRFVNSVKYGSVQIVIQDGKVIQIDSTQKTRFDKPQNRDHYGHKPASFRGR